MLVRLVGLFELLIGPVRFNWLVDWWIGCLFLFEWLRAWRIWMFVWWLDLIWVDWLMGLIQWLIGSVWFVWSVVWLIDCLMDKICWIIAWFGWAIDRLFHCLVGWFDWLIDWLSWLAKGLVVLTWFDWLIWHAWVIDWSIGWVVGRTWLMYWLIDRLSGLI